MKFDYTLEPGKELNKENIFIDDKVKPVISIITPFYNSGQYIRQTAYSVLNQTFPYFEWLIIDDGSKDKESLEELEKIKSLDKRIKVYHKENGGLADTRDYGANKASKDTKYFFFLDDDDLIDKTYLECAYWALETNPEASFAYGDVVGFAGKEFLWKKWFDSEREKTENLLVATSLIRKNDFFENGGYELKEKAVNEDWNFWLKLLAKGKKPLHMSYYSFWYRQKINGELAKSKKNFEHSYSIIKKTAETVKNRVEAIQFPRNTYDWNDVFKANDLEVLQPVCKKNSKKNILVILPWMTMGGADKFNVELISRMDKNKYNFIIVSTVLSNNPWRQKLEPYASAIYDLTSFIDRKYWHLFINYIIKKNNIDTIFNTNSIYGYMCLPYIKSQYPKINVIDYIHMEEWYNRNGGYSRDSASVTSTIDMTLTCNKNSEKILHDYFKVDNNKIKTVYIGVDEEVFNPKLYDRKKLMEKYQIPNDKFVIGFIARIDYQKRPFLLAQIINELSKERQDFVCVVAGDGQLMKPLLNNLKGEKIDQYFKFVGAVNNTQEIYSICDMTLNCSIKEGLALTTYESLSMGVPVVSSNVGGQAEIINEKVGCVVPCMQKEEDVTVLTYQKEEVDNYVVAINKVLNNITKYKRECRKSILNGWTINQMVNNMDSIFGNVKTKNNVVIPKEITLELLDQFLLNIRGENQYLIDNYISTEYKVIPNFKELSFTEKMKHRTKNLLFKMHIFVEAKIIGDMFKYVIYSFKLLFIQIGRRIKNIFKKIKKWIIK